jgi:hypothetical protein
LCAVAQRTAAQVAIRETGTMKTSIGLPASGETDAATWQAVLAMPVQPADWVSRGAGARAAAAGAAGRAPASAGLPARREEISPPGQRR